MRVHVLLARHAFVSELSGILGEIQRLVCDALHMYWEIWIVFETVWNLIGHGWYCSFPTARHATPKKYNYRNSPNKKSDSRKSGPQEQVGKIAQKWAQNKIPP